MTIVNSEPCAPRGARTVLEGASTAGLPHDLDVDVAWLRLMKADHQSKQYRLEDQLLKHFPHEIERDKQLIDAFRKDIALLEAHPLPEKDFVGMTVDGQVLTEKEAAGKAILASCKNAAKGIPVTVGTYRGMEISVQYDLMTNHFQMTLRGSVSHRTEVGNSAEGNVIRMDNALATIPKRLNDTEAHLASMNQQMEAAKTEVGKPFPQESELRTKSARLAELDAELNMDRQSDKEQPKKEEPER